MSFFEYIQTNIKIQSIKDNYINLKVYIIQFRSKKSGPINAIYFDNINKTFQGGSKNKELQIYEIKNGKKLKLLGENRQVAY